MSGCKKTVLFSIVISGKRLVLVKQTGCRQGQRYECGYVAFQYQYWSSTKRRLVWKEHDRTAPSTVDAARSTLIRWACIHFKLDAYGPELPTLETLAMLSQGGE